MYQSPFQNALAAIKAWNQNSRLENPIKELEALFKESHVYQGSFKEFMGVLIDDHYWKSQSCPNNPYSELCIELASLIDAHYFSEGCKEPPYHSRKHFQDVCLSLTVLLDQSSIYPKKAGAKFDESWVVSAEEAWILLFCAAAHDFGHDGSINTVPGQMESLSIRKVQSFLAESSATPELKKRMGLAISPIILATEPAFMQSLLTKFSDTGGEPTKSDCLCMLLVEADLLASTLPVRGKMLSSLLADEWSLTNPIASSKVASNKGRISFLESIRFVSPYAIMLGMEDIRSHSIELLKE